MKKVAIITMNGFTNYGNRLQNIALSELFEREGFQVINGFNYHTKTEWVRSSSNIVAKIIKFFTPFPLFQKRYSSLNSIPNGINGSRFVSFKKYYNQYHSSLFSPLICRNDDEVRNYISQLGIDYFVVGSDQVWNPHFECHDYELLTAVPDEKKFSFSASFGVISIDNKTKKKLKDKLGCFKYLSVREQSAVNLIRSITGRTADLTIDPTLLLSKEDWQEYIQVPNYVPSSKYICTYFLGEIPSAVQEFAKEKKMEVISLNDSNFPDLYGINPGEFLYYIQNADYVFTDSFHAVAFSIKFHKKFCVFNRKQVGVENMFTRIESILNLLHLENHIYNDSLDFEHIEDNWEKIDEVLNIAKVNALKRISEAGLKP